LKANRRFGGTGSKENPSKKNQHGTDSSKFIFHQNTQRYIPGNVTDLASV
jgi:hypothetical protein